MPKLYRHALSGHSHRAQLFLSLLGEDAELVDVDLMAGALKSDSFLSLNPFGQVPALDDDGTIVSDSNAILVYLAESRGAEAWYPRDPKARAEIQRWLSVAANELANGPATARLVTVFGAKLDYERAVKAAATLLGTIEKQLAARSFLVDDSPTIADVAGYSYIAHAPEGGVDLEPFPAVRAWLERIESLPGFVPMQKSEV